MFSIKMAKQIISLILLIVSVFLNFRNAWASFNALKNPGSLKMMAALGIKATYVPVMGVVILLAGVLLLFPKTFLPANIINATSIVVIMALAANSGNYKMLLMEIPFLALPLIMIWLKYPFKN